MDKHLSELGNERVLVTGATGFIGSSLCRALKELGSEIHTISRTEPDGFRDGCYWRQLDIADRELVQAACRDVAPQTIFHLASYVSGSRDIGVVEATFHANLISTLNLLLISHELDIRRLVLAGSLEEHLNSVQEPPCSPYAAAKIAASAYSRMFHALYATPVVTARLFMVYGPNQKDLNKLIPSVILALRQGQPIKLGSGKRNVDWIYIDDVVDGLLRCATEPGIEGKTIDLGSGRFYRISEVIAMLYQQLGIVSQPPFGSLPDRPMEVEIKANIDQTYEQIGWQPQVPLAEGLRRTIDWYQRLEGL